MLFPNLIVNSVEVEWNYEDRPLISTYEYYKSDVTNFLVKFKKENTAIVKRIIIPAASKSAILNQLGLFGITEEFLFSDSVDKVCKSIRKKYLKYYN